MKISFLVAAFLLLVTGYPGAQEMMQRFEPPIRSYVLPMQVYEPVQIYRPPVEIYKPPVQIYRPPVEIYKPPVQIYRPPVEIYKPPVQIYRSPVEIYKPSMKTVERLGSDQSGKLQTGSTGNSDTRTQESDQSSGPSGLENGTPAVPETQQRKHKDPATANGVRGLLRLSS